MSRSPKVNKVPYDFASLELSIAMSDGSPLSIINAFSEISYSDNVEREKMRGTERVALDFTDGEYDAEGSITFYRHAFDYIIEECKARGIGFYQMEFTMTVNYRRRGEVMHTDTLTRVMFGSRENAHSTGAAALTVPCDLFIGDRIYHDGIGPFGEKLSG